MHVPYHPGADHPHNPIHGATIRDVESAVVSELHWPEPRKPCLSDGSRQAPAAAENLNGEPRLPACSGLGSAHLRSDTRMRVRVEAREAWRRTLERRRRRWRIHRPRRGWLGGGPSDHGARAHRWCRMLGSRRRRGDKGPQGRRRGHARPCRRRGRLCRRRRLLGHVVGAQHGIRREGSVGSSGRSSLERLSVSLRAAANLTGAEHSIVRQARSTIRWIALRLDMPPAPLDAGGDAQASADPQEGIQNWVLRPPLVGREDL